MFDEQPYREQMDRTLTRFNDEMKKVRTGRAHTDMLAGVKAEVYGQFSPLNQVASITVTDATMLTVTPFDPNTINNITAAIRNDSTLGLNPTDDGKVIRVPVPPLTEERRKEIVKTANTKVEEAKVSIRNIREDARKSLKSAELPEDTQKKAEQSIDSLTKDFAEKIDTAFKEKSAEIMKI